MLLKLCFASSDAELSKMQNAYPAMFLVSSSIAALLKQEGIEPHVVAGYNTGEYAALFAAKAMSFPDGLYLLHKYAQSYQELLDELKEVDLVRVTGISVLMSLKYFAKRFVIQELRCMLHYNLSTTEHIVSGLVPAIEQVRESLECCTGS